MKEIDDKFLKEFFEEHKQEIPDNGFSHKVISRLPGKKITVISNIWVLACSALAIILFLTMDGLQAIWEVVRETFVSMAIDGLATIDPRSLAIAAVVLLFMGVRKVWSMV